MAISAPTMTQPASKAPKILMGIGIAITVLAVAAIGLYFFGGNIHCLQPFLHNMHQIPHMNAYVGVGAGLTAVSIAIIVRSIRKYLTELRFSYKGKEIILKRQLIISKDELDRLYGDKHKNIAVDYRSSKDRKNYSQENFDSLEAIIISLDKQVIECSSGATNSLLIQKLKLLATTHMESEITRPIYNMLFTNELGMLASKNKTMTIIPSLDDNVYKCEFTYHTPIRYFPIDLVANISTDPIYHIKITASLDVVKNADGSVSFSDLKIQIDEEGYSGAVAI